MRERPGALMKGVCLFILLPTQNQHTHTHTVTTLWLVSSSPNLHLVAQAKSSLVLLILPSPSASACSLQHCGIKPGQLQDVCRGKSTSCTGACASAPVYPVLQKEGSQRNTSSCAAMSSTVQVQPDKSIPCTDR